MDEHIDTIEAGYEYLLAYAAQGKDIDTHDGGAKSEVRQTLEGMENAARSIRELMSGSDVPFHSVVVDDAIKTEAAIALVLAQAGISSEMVDNLNASIHVRALLTDLFLVSEAAGQN